MKDVCKVMPVKYRLASVILRDVAGFQRCRCLMDDPWQMLHTTFWTKGMETHLLYHYNK